MEDANLILTLTALDGYSEESLQLDFNEERCPTPCWNNDESPSRDPTPGPEQEYQPSKLMLKLDQSRINMDTMRSWPDCTVALT